MALVRGIPAELRQALADDPYMHQCCIGDTNCAGKIDFHHNLIYAGRRVNEPFAILPVCSFHHAKADTREVREKLNWAMVNRMSEADIAKYSRFNWAQLISYLKSKFT